MRPDRTEELRAAVNIARMLAQAAVLDRALWNIDAALSEEGSELNGSALRRVEDAKAVLLHLRSSLDPQPQGVVDQSRLTDGHS